MAGERVHLGGGVQRAEQWPEPADHGVKIQCRRGATQRDRVAGPQFLGSARAFLDRQVAVPPDQVVVLDDSPAAVGEYHGVVGPPELDLHGGIVSDGEVLDLADFHTGDADEVLAFQSTDVGEHSGVGLLAIEAQLREHGDECECAERAHDHEDPEAPHDG